MARRAAALVLVALALSVLAAIPPARAADLAPSWTLTDIDGNNVSSSALRGHVVVLDFAGTWCGPCKIVEAAFEEIYANYSAKGVVFLSVFEPPANSVQDIQNYRAARNVPWKMAPDTDGVSSRYSVYEIPRFFVIDKDGYVTSDWATYPGFTQGAAREAAASALDRTLQGTATPFTITAASIPILLVIAAVLSFFSPCSFPVLPAFMAFYLNLDAKGNETTGVKATTKTAAARGFVSSLGIVTVYGLIALVLLAAGVAAQAAVGQAIVWLPPIIGVILILFGILTLLPFQYHFLTRPFSALKKRLAARLGKRWTPGLKAKLFAFGMGYGAAGFACVAPPFIAAVLYASTLGSFQEAVLGLLLYVLVVIALMIVIVVAIHTAGDRAMKKIRAWSGIIKYVSAAALIIAGVYLLWLFLSTSVFVG